MASLEVDKVSLVEALAFARETGEIQTLGKVLGEAVAEAFAAALAPKVEVRLSRDRLAAMAMQALLSRGYDENAGSAAEGIADVAHAAYTIADAMIAEREKREATR